jgi:phospholipase C
MSQSPLPLIEHVVVLMLENRSFDHLMGFFPGTEGLNGTEFNLLDPSTSESSSNRRFTVGKDAPFRLLPGQGEGPSHSLNATNVQLSGRQTGPTADHAPVCNGFIANYRSTLKSKHIAFTDEDLRLPMLAFEPDRLPAINALAREFVLCDHWFCDVPGPTQPNRLFAHAGTSAGYGHNVWDHVFSFRTIYNSLQEAGKTWAVYYADDNEVAKFSQVVARTYTKPDDEIRWQDDQAAGARGGFFDFKTFFARHASTGRLPNYTFIVPNFGDGGGPEDEVNSMHPPHDVRPGDRLVADVYEALRGNGAIWPKTLLVVTFDEHGGFYDHVPPGAAVNPDGLTSPPAGDESFAPTFAFDRLGLRVPTILVSPWLPRGRIDSTSYRHTSILAALKELYGLSDFLTQRDRTAASFVALLSELTAMRTDTPMTLLRPALTGELEAVGPDDADQPPDELLGGMLQGWFQIAKSIPTGLESMPVLAATSREAHEFIREQVTRLCEFRVTTQPQYFVKPRAGGFGWELATLGGPVLASSSITYPTHAQAVQAIRDWQKHALHAPIVG